jgi:sugar phosphate isomerase/epimerase
MVLRGDDMIERRAFLTAAAGGAAALSLGAVEPARPARMRLGSVAWNFRGIGQGPPWDEAIKATAELGFAGIDLIVARAEELDAYWKEPELARVKAMLAELHLACPQFVLFQNAVAGLGSRDAAERRKALAGFEKGCAAAKALGAPMINIVAPWPTEITGPSAYLPRYYAIDERKNPPPAREKLQIKVPAGFPYARAWDEFVAAMREATAMAKAHGLRFSLENHTHTLVPTTDAFLRLYDKIDDPALGMNLDIGWIWINREYPPLAIYKLGARLCNVHIRDIDGLALWFPAVGEGRLDYPAVIEALDDVGFRGFLTIEQDSVPNQREALVKGRTLLEGLLA